MKKYLSIGDVSKMTGIHIKSLRYYDRIGVFPPAHTSEKTGYRYYTMQQLPILEVIAYLIELDIPLKKFSDYMIDDNQVNIEKLLSDGQRILQEKIKWIESTDHFFKCFQEQQSYDAHIRSMTGAFGQEIKARYFLCNPLVEQGDLVETFMKELMGLYQEIETSQLLRRYNEGLLKKRENEKWMTYTYVEIEKPPVTTEKIHVIPSGLYKCEVMKNINIQSIFERYSRNDFQSDIVLFRELFTDELSEDLMDIEVQQLLSC